MLGYRVLVDKLMLGNMLEAKPERTELEFAAFNSGASKTSTTVKVLHIKSILIVISFLSCHITIDFLFASSGLAVRLFVHLEIKYDRCISGCFAAAITIIP